ncbi:MAG: F0F1 ATP synthase subunit A [Actinobacteria bacterium]|nr:F0F1 ATP synthase subunit A [Actinomycetota bacterium]
MGDIVKELLDFHLGFLTAHQLLLVLAMVLTTGVFLWASRAISEDAPKNRVLSLIEYSVIWVRDEICYPFMGPEDGRRFLPLILTLFFFILFSNLFGLIPFPFTPADKTDALVVATGNIAVTAALALIVLLVSNVAGIIRKGPFGYLAGLVPPGLPKPIIPLLFLLEFIGLFTKILALLVRLFANMLAGHAIFAVLFGVLLGIGAFGVGKGGIAMTLVGTLGIMAIFLLEVFIAFLQAAIFAGLAALFIHQAVATEH